MSTGTTTPATEVDAALARLIEIVGRLSDGDLHRSHRNGGWTVAQVISHINVCNLMWFGDLARLRNDPDLRFFYREEIGHDATGYPPPTVEIALGQLASTRRTLATCLPTVDDELAACTVEIPDLGTMTIADWTPIITDHLISHTQQAIEILTDRNVLPAGV
jgi:uncharacterized damage-inducible protein DinB